MTIDSSAKGSNVCPDLRRINRDMGFRKVSLDFPFGGGGMGVRVVLELPDSFSLMPLISEVCDLEKLE